MIAAVHLLFRERLIVGVWLNGQPTYLPGYPRAEADGYRAMAQKPDNLSFEQWADFLADRAPSNTAWWETTEVSEGEAADAVIQRLQAALG